ncbi:MAG: hypothetical protein ABL996_14045 [Micropepsaceae bacterium]
MRYIRLILGVLGGCAAVVLVAVVMFALLRAAWPAYAAAEPLKAYSLDMLLARLAVGVMSGLSAGGVATLVAGDRGRAALLVGAVFLSISLRPHLVTGWSDYPVWYHVVYLSYIIPVAYLGGYLTRSVTERLLGRQIARRAPGRKPTRGPDQSNLL